ncbi:hypothetical protein Enr17x_22120 [Gimesia fumaroli]|uniref:Uncharacterized protein n=1 Tax=Gimesia fumaroli TaxID=2527976 RepID=A0A518IAP9_9PLAN|nr:hypothetical protein Enr17x_22120 [Gimesia fumaroli]
MDAKSQFAKIKMKWIVQTVAKALSRRKAFLFVLTKFFYLGKRSIKSGHLFLTLEVQIPLSDEEDSISDAVNSCFKFLTAASENCRICSIKCSVS